jgi:hypothetical protein
LCEFGQETKKTQGFYARVLREIKDFWAKQNASSWLGFMIEKNQFCYSVNKGMTYTCMPSASGINYWILTDEGICF